MCRHARSESNGVLDIIKKEHKMGGKNNRLELNKMAKYNEVQHYRG